MRNLTIILTGALFIGVAMLSPASLGQSGSLAQSDGLPEMIEAADDAQAFDAFAEWLRRFETGESQYLTENGRVTIAAVNLQETQDVVAEGVRLAAARQPTMLRLMRQNPWLALNQAMTWRQWVILPQQVRELVEEPFSEMGDLEVVPDCRPLSERQIPWQTHRVTIRGRTFDAFVYGRPETMTSKYGVPLQGVMLGGKVVLWESPVVVLAPEMLAVARELFPDGNARDRSWWSGQALGPDACVALCGGKLYHFASQDEAEALARVITDAESLLGPNTVLHAFAAAAGPEVFDAAEFERVAVILASAWTEAPKRILAIRLDYTPSRGTPYAERELQAELFTSSNAIRDMSYGKTWLVYTVTREVLVLPGSKEDYENGTRDDSRDAREAAEAAGYNLADYDIYLYSFPARAGAPAWAGGAHAWINGRSTPSIFVHEFGHNYGVGHANFWLGMTGVGLLGHQNPDGSTVENEEYGDVFDLMGNDRRAVLGGTPVWPNGHYSMSMKAYLNWIEAAEVLTTTSSGRYRIYRFDHKDARSAAGQPLALKINLGAQGQLWVGFRRNFVKNASLSSGAYIVWAPTASWHRLIDTTPLSRPGETQDMDREDAASTPGKSYTDPSGTVRITNVGWGGAAPFEYLDLDVTLLDTSPAIELFTDSSGATRGLLGRYVNQNLRGRREQENWADNPDVVIAGTRVDANLYFPTNGWGNRASVGLTKGANANWENFSVQWDGVVVVNRPVQMATRSDDSSRMWIDLNGDGVFGTATPEFINNHWGTGQSATQGDISKKIPPGTYLIRIQYEEGNGDNTFALIFGEAGSQFELFTDAALTTAGLNASFVNRSLRQYANQDDWRSSQTISGRRVDGFPGFTTESWGQRSAVGITGGSDAGWDNFSVQWDGYLRVYQPMRFVTISDDGSRMWIDLNNDGVFGRSTEFIDNHWGSGQSLTEGNVSVDVGPGAYRLRMQYEEGAGGNSFLLGGTPAQASAPTSGSIITGVVRANGMIDNRPPIGAYDGNTSVLPTQAGGLADGNLCYSDRTYPWAYTPRALAGAEYVRTFNSDKGSSTVTYAVTISKTATVMIAVDDRVVDKQWAVNAATARFAPAGRFADTGLDLSIQENATTSRPMSVFSARLPSGTYVFGPMPSVNNFYTIAAMN